MLGSRFCVRTVSGVGSAVVDHTNAATTAHSFPNSVAVDFSPLRSRRRRAILISCNSSPRRSNSDDSYGNDYLEASLLLSGQIPIEKLMDAEFEQESEDCLDQFQFVKDLVGRLDHEVIMVRITERVISTYFARLYLRKPRKSDHISVDARPSDAIIVANRCKDLVGFHVTPSFCSSNLRMEGTMLFFCNVMVIPQPLKPFSMFPSITTCSKLLSLQSLKFPTKCNAHSENRNMGRQKMCTITKEEVVVLNKRLPDFGANSGKWLPLHTLAACGEFHLLDSLLKHNIDINAVDKDGLTALHKAIGKKLSITKYLLKNSANPFVRDQERATLMHYAVRTASTETIELLLLYNVDINLQDNDGWTPLHLAVQTQRPNLVRLLLIKGADKTLRNKDGLTPLDLCLYSGQSFQTYALIKLLKQSRECL